MFSSRLVNPAEGAASERVSPMVSVKYLVRARGTATSRTLLGPPPPPLFQRQLLSYVATAAASAAAAIHAARDSVTPRKLIN